MKLFHTMPYHELPTDKRIFAITYTLADLAFCSQVFNPIAHNLSLIAHRKFMIKAKYLKLEFPQMRLALRHQVHSKVLMVEGGGACGNVGRIYIGSANIGISGWHESIVRIDDSTLYNTYMEEFFQPLWLESLELTTDLLHKSSDYGSH